MAHRTQVPRKYRWGSAINSSLLVVGNLVYDLLAGPVERLEWDTTTWPEYFAAGLGGNGAVTSYAAAKLGARVRLITAVGKDAAGLECMEFLRAAGVDAVFLASEIRETAVTLGLFRPDGARALIHRPGVLARAFEVVLSLSQFADKETGWLHVANPFAVPALRRNAALYLAEGKDKGWKTSLDTGWDREGEWMGVIGPCLSRTDWLFTNQAEALALTGCDEVPAAANALQAAGAANVVIKSGAEGCYLRLSGGEEFPVPALPVQAIDSTGAGDCFCGAFLAAMQRGENVRLAAAIANVYGAKSVSAAGSTTALCDWDQALAGAALLL